MRAVCTLGQVCVTHQTCLSRDYAASDIAAGCRAALAQYRDDDVRILLRIAAYALAEAGLGARVMVAGPAARPLRAWTGRRGAGPPQRPKARKA